MGLAMLTAKLGELALLQQDRVTARSCFEESLHLFQTIKDAWGIAVSTLSLGDLHLLERYVTGL